MTNTRMCIAAIVGVAAGAVTGCGNGSTPAADVQRGEQAEFADVKQACQVFTLEMARQILGDGARPSGTTPFAGSSDHLAGSTCTYEAEDQTPASRFATLVTATVTLNGAKTDTGRRSNRAGFEENRTTLAQPGAAEMVEGLGDAAFYIGGVINQLHVLADDGRYAVIVSASDPDGDDRAATEQLARRVLESL